MSPVQLHLQATTAEELYSRAGVSGGEVIQPPPAPWPCGCALGTKHEAASSRSTGITQPHHCTRVPVPVICVGACPQELTL